MGRRDDILDMRVLRLFNFAAVAPVVLYLGVDARSEARDRISHVYAVENPIINTRNQQVEHDSSFDLIFSLQNEAPRVKLSLEPNHNILGGQKSKFGYRVIRWSWKFGLDHPRLLYMLLLSEA